MALYLSTQNCSLMCVFFYQTPQASSIALFIRSTKVSSNTYIIALQFLLQKHLLQHCLCKIYYAKVNKSIAYSNFRALYKPSFLLLLSRMCFCYIGTQYLPKACELRSITELQLRINQSRKRKHKNSFLLMPVLFFQERYKSVLNFENLILQSKMHSL